MSKEDKEVIEAIVEEIDKKRERLKEEYKKSSQYKQAGKYKKVHQNYLNVLLERRNTLVSVLNYDYTKDIRNLKKLIDDE